MRAMFPDSWEILANKGYPGVTKILHVIYQKNKQIENSLSSENEETKRKISSDKIKVENYFGRL